MQRLRIGFKRQPHKGVYNLGLTYKNGRGVKQDYTEALRWVCMATAKDLPLQRAW